MAASPPLTLMSAQVNQKCRRKWPPSLHSSTWHWLQRLEDVIWFYILFFKSKKRQPSMLSWNDRPIPFTGKDDLEKCVAENECSFWVWHSFVILRHHLCILYIYIYILIFLFSCAVVGPKKRICWLSSTSWHPWNMQLVVLPFHFKGSSVLKYSIVFFLLLGRCPDSQPRHFF